MFRYLFLGLLFNWAKAFNVPPSTFSGSLGPYQLKLVEKPMASYFFKRQQIQTIVEDLDKGKANEFDEAKHWCRSHRNDDSYFVTAIELEDIAEYFVLYRHSPRHILTIEGIVRSQHADTLSMAQLMLMLRKQTPCYLQMQDIHRWANGRYHIELKLENMFGE